jgi:hypothetical protein
VVNAPNNVKDWISQKKCIFPLLAFLIPLIVRTIPEILMGPYIVGFDTMGFYVPNTLLWLHNGINFGDFLATAPLFYTIFMSIVAAGGSPVFVLKVIPPLLLGFLGLSMYAYAQRGLGWSPSRSVFVALLGSIYFVALRTSWDQLREELGLIFFFTVLSLLIYQKGRSWKTYSLLSLVMVVVVLSHQLVSVLMFGVIICTVVYNLFRRNFVDSITLILSSLPAVLYFFTAYLSDVLHSGFLNYSRSGVSSLANWTGFASYQSMLVDAGGFFLYCFILLLPLALVNLRRLQNLQLKAWLLLSLILVLVPIASISPYRWILMLTYPLVFFVAETIGRLRSIKWKRYKFTVRRIVLLYLVLSTAVLSLGYVIMTPDKPFFYFNPNYLNSYEYQIPTSMLQNTISITDCKDTVNSLLWLKDNANNSSILLTHTVFYSWALLTLNVTQVKNYEFDAPDAAARAVAQEEHSQIYLIWWTKGHGWYDQPTLPSSFTEVYHSGEIAIYSYNLS